METWSAYYSNVQNIHILAGFAIAIITCAHTIHGITDNENHIIVHGWQRCPTTTTTTQLLCSKYFSFVFIRVLLHCIIYFFFVKCLVQKRTQFFFQLQILLGYLFCDAPPFILISAKSVRSSFIMKYFAHQHWLTTFVKLYRCNEIFVVVVVIITVCTFFTFVAKLILLLHKGIG